MPTDSLLETSIFREAESIPPIQNVRSKADLFTDGQWRPHVDTTQPFADAGLEGVEA